MFNINIEIKNFFYKKTKINNVSSIYFLGIPFKYTNSSAYKKLIKVLRYIKPYLTINIDDLLNKLEKRSKNKFISVKKYLEDEKDIKNIIDNFDASLLPPCSGKLRKLQLNRLEFAKKIISEIEKDTGLKPFMDDGTLLGAVRHKGFIPWDDDLDFSLMRADYEKLVEYLSSKYKLIDTSNWSGKTYKKHIKQCLEDFPNEIFCIRNATSFKIFQGTVEMYNVVDFFALDCFNDNFNVITLQEYINNAKQEINKRRLYSEKFDFYRSEISKNEAIVEDSDTISAGIDNYDFMYYQIKGIRRKKDIFPLIKMKFEDTEFYAPNNPDKYLKTIYNNYMRIPLDIRIANHNNDKDISLG